METNGSTDSKFCQVKIAENIAKGTCQTDELCAETVQKYLSGEKCKEQRQEIEYQIDFGVQQTFMYS